MFFVEECPTYCTFGVPCNSHLSIVVHMKMNLWRIAYLEITDDTYLVIDLIQLAIDINNLYVHFTTLTCAYKLIAQNKLSEEWE